MTDAEIDWELAQPAPGWDRLVAADILTLTYADPTNRTQARGASDVPGAKLFIVTTSRGLNATTVVSIDTAREHLRRLELIEARGEPDVHPLWSK